MKILPLLTALLLAAQTVLAATATVEDVPTRPGVTIRALVLAPENPKGVVLLYPGGHGGLQLTKEGAIGWGEGNFLVRTRQLFAEKGFITVVLDAPSDRQKEPFLSGFRQKPDHAADARALIKWARAKANVPVWLVGTSRGTQSVAYLATELKKEEGPDGIVLTSTILIEKGKARAVPQMELAKITVPVLVVHHESDGCDHCNPEGLPGLMEKFSGAPRKELIKVSGGKNVGDPCDALAHHGYNGIETLVVGKIAEWMIK